MALICIILPNLVAFGDDYVKVAEDRPYCLWQKCSLKNLVFLRYIIYGSIMAYLYCKKDNAVWNFITTPIN